MVTLFLNQVRLHSLKRLCENYVFMFTKYICLLPCSIYIICTYYVSAKLLSVEITIFAYAQGKDSKSSIFIYLNHQASVLMSLFYINLQFLEGNVQEFVFQIYIIRFLIKSTTGGHVGYTKPLCMMLEAEQYSELPSVDLTTITLPMGTTKLLFKIENPYRMIISGDVFAVLNWILYFPLHRKLTFQKQYS